MTSFRLDFSRDHANWITLTADGLTTLALTGNTVAFQGHAPPPLIPAIQEADAILRVAAPQKQTLPFTINTRWLRFYPLAWNILPALRVEAYVRSLCLCLRLICCLGFAGLHK